MAARTASGLYPGEVLASLPAGAGPQFTIDAPTGAFYVRIVAVLSEPLQMSPSNEVRLFVNTPTPPSPPADLRGLVDGTSVTLSWTNTFAGGAPTSLRLHVNGAANATLALPLSETVTFAGVPPGRYTLSLSAVNAAGASAVSNAVTLTFPEPCTGVPGSPTSFQAWTVGATIFLAWNAPAAGPAVSGYTVRVSGAYAGTLTTTGRTMSGAAAPGRYGLSVVADNVCGASLPTPEQVVVIP